MHSAQKAKAALNGADIYAGCCTLKIEYARVSLTLVVCIFVFSLAILLIVSFIVCSLHVLMLFGMIMIAGITANPTWTGEVGISNQWFLCKHEQLHLVFLVVYGKILLGVLFRCCPGYCLKGCLWQLAVSYFFFIQPLFTSCPFSLYRSHTLMRGRDAFPNHKLARCFSTDETLFLRVKAGQGIQKSRGGRLGRLTLHLFMHHWDNYKQLSEITILKSDLQLTLTAFCMHPYRTSSQWRTFENILFICLDSVWCSSSMEAVTWMYSDLSPVKWLQISLKRTGEHAQSLIHWLLNYYIHVLWTIYQCSLAKVYTCQVTALPVYFQ